MEEEIIMRCPFKFKSSTPSFERNLEEIPLKHSFEMMGSDGFLSGLPQCKE